MASDSIVDSSIENEYALPEELTEDGAPIYTNEQTTISQFDSA